MSPKLFSRIKQCYAGLIPLFPLGYVIVHGFRGDQIWTKVYINRSTVEASDHLKELVEQEVDKIDGLKKAKFNVVLTDDMEPKVYGGLFLTNGAELQFPLRMTLDDVETARRMGANLEVDLGLSKNRRKVEVNSDTGDELISRLMLSEQAKRFLIQRQLQIANSGEFFAVPLIAWFGISTIGYMILNGVAMIIGPIGATMCAVGFSAGGYYQFVNIFESYKTKKADEIVAKRGEEYSRGAIDYFKSTMKLNRLFRKILGEEGDRQIKKNGDAAVDPVMLSQRIRDIQKIRKEMAKKKEEEEEF